MSDRVVLRFVRGSAASITMCAFAACGTGARATPPAPLPLEVEVATVSERDVAVSSEWIATLDGYLNAQVRPQVTQAEAQLAKNESGTVPLRYWRGTAVTPSLLPSRRPSPSSYEGGPGCGFGHAVVIANWSGIMANRVPQLSDATWPHENRG